MFRSMPNQLTPVCRTANQRRAATELTVQEQGKMDRGVATTEKGAVLEHKVFVPVMDNFR